MVNIFYESQFEEVLFVEIIDSLEIHFFCQYVLWRQHFEIFVQFLSQIDFLQKRQIYTIKIF